MNKKLELKEQNISLEGWHENKKGTRISTLNYFSFTITVIKPIPPINKTMQPTLL